MIKIASKLIFALGLVSLLFIIYVLTFYLTRNGVILPFEKENRPSTHKIRPIYNTIYYPMRKFVANGSSFRPEVQDVYYGTLEKPWFEDDDEKNHRSAQINTPDDSSVSIGFTGKPSILKEFDEIKYGSYVNMVFGVALTKEHDRFINRLISFDVINLIDDPRIKEESFSKEESEIIYEKFNGIQGAEKVCSANFLKDYKNSILEHCLQAGYAQNIGGGCYHIVGYSLNPTVLKQAMEKCSAADVE